VKFLLDNCVTRRLADLLKAHGHECERVAHWPNRKADDPVILAHAAVHQQVLVTLDKDFDELVRIEGMEHSGLVRLTVSRPELQEEVMQRLLKLHGDELENALVIAGLQKIRITKPSN
jgi:predicted nuclease of predicted toxin-antitoxin system